MDEILKATRRRFLNRIADGVSGFQGKLILLTHLLPDRPELLEAFSKIAPIELTIAIPYSTHRETFENLQKRYKILTPTLTQLSDTEFLTKHVVRAVGDEPVVIVEIGGYFASALSRLQRLLEGRLIGVVEDTEHGHRRYEALNLPCPVVSVARSTLKEAEDLVVGPSCIFSTEKLLRSVGYLLEAKSTLVLGFGHVGKGIARSLTGRRIAVAVYDINPVKRAIALSSGYSVPNRAVAIRNAEVIFGATGCQSLAAKDFGQLRRGVVLVSCSSKDVEFDVESLKTYHDQKIILDGIDQYTNEDSCIYLLAQGCPVNFIDGAVMGPVLTLVQAECLVAIGHLLKNRQEHEILEVPCSERMALAEAWMEVFLDSEAGSIQFA